ncbi:hypothetical protein [Viridibacillus arvi]|uniref:hypothetical protein n=1 Tax=Viridibacillus arvi TaxID=263475 RepID=UPI0034CD7FF1
MSTTQITEQILALDKKAIVENIQPTRRKGFAVTNVSLSLSVSKNKLKKTEIEKNVFMDLNQNRNITIEDPSDYDTLINYLHYAYTKYAAPMLSNFGRFGDIITIEADITEECEFVNDEITVGIRISIPNFIKEKNEWQTYVKNTYGDLTKLKGFFEQTVFEIRDHQIQKVDFQFKFKMQGKQTVKYLSDNTKVEPEEHENILAFWYGVFNEIEKTRKEEKQHTHNIPVKIVPNEFGGLALEYCQETVKAKL